MFNFAGKHCCSSLHRICFHDLAVIFIAALCAIVFIKSRQIIETCLPVILLI